jgi:hypothetical protein
LKDHINKNGKPDLVLITDYHSSHVFSEFTIDNHEYNFLSSPSVLNEWTEQKTYPKEIHLVRQEEFIKDRDRGEQFLREKTKKHHDQLIEELKQYDVPFAHCLFEGAELDNIERHIDLTDSISKYKDGNNVGVHSKNKFDCQKEIADKVRPLIEDCLADSS